MIRLCLSALCCAALLVTIAVCIFRKYHRKIGMRQKQGQHTPVEQVEGSVIAQWQWRAVVVAAWVIVVFAGGVMAWFYPPAPRFACVEWGVLYRSGQPGGDALRVLLRRYAIRTVVNLRSPGKLRSDPLARQEVAFARDHGIDFINLPYGDPSPKVQVEKFLAIVGDSASHPVLIHCAVGKERSGVMVAAWRMRTQGWSFDEAFAEMKSFGFNPDEKPNMRRFVERIAEAAQ